MKRFVLYFFGYKTEFHLSKTIPIFVNRSRSLGLFRKGKTGILAKFNMTEGKTPAFKPNKYVNELPHQNLLCL